MNNIQVIYTDVHTNKTDIVSAVIFKREINQTSEKLFYYLNLTSVHGSLIEKQPLFKLHATLNTSDNLTNISQVTIPPSTPDMVPVGYCITYSGEKKSLKNFLNEIPNNLFPLKAISGILHFEINKKSNDVLIGYLVENNT